MVLVVSPLSVFAADLLEFTDSTSINTENYSFIVGQGDDFVANVLEGVSKDKTITVAKGETATIVLNAGDYTSETYGSVNFADQTTGSYHYGMGNTNSRHYCLATDTAFSVSCADEDVTAAVTGFGAESTGNGKYGKDYTSAISTTFTIDTSALEAGVHSLTLSFKYQMKSVTCFNGMELGSWSTNKEYVGSIEGINLVVEDEITTAVGGSIRVGDVPGLRFGFETDASNEEVEEYGFVYAYKDTKDLTIDKVGTDGVCKLVAENRITHPEGNTTFNLVFIDVPSSAYNTVVSARSYVVIDGEYHYSEVVSYSFKQIADLVIADPAVDQNTKDAVQKLLDA